VCSFEYAFTAGPCCRTSIGVGTAFCRFGEILAEYTERSSEKSCMRDVVPIGATSRIKRASAIVSSTTSSARTGSPVKMRAYRRSLGKAASNSLALNDMDMPRGCGRATVDGVVIPLTAVDRNKLHVHPSKPLVFPLEPRSCEALTHTPRRPNRDHTRMLSWSWDNEVHLTTGISTHADVNAPQCHGQGNPAPTRRSGPLPAIREGAGAVKRCDVVRGWRYSDDNRRMNLQR
jgi:hypothetical protein